MQSTELFIKKVVKVQIAEKDIELVQFLSNGLGRKQIAAKLRMTSKGIDSRIRLLKPRIDCTSLAHIVAFFFRNKLIK